MIPNATPGPSASGARLTGDDTQHAIAWYHAIRALQAGAGIRSVAVEAAGAGNVDDVVIRRRLPPDDYLQVKATVSAGRPATIDWLMADTPTRGPGILRKFYRFYATLNFNEVPAQSLQLVTTRSIAPDDPVLTLRDRNDCVADRLRRATTLATVRARRLLADHLEVDEETLCNFLEHLRIRTDASEAAWREHISHLSLALGLRYDEQAFRLGVSEVREWVKTSRAEKTPDDIAEAVERLGLRSSAGWEVLIIQALDWEEEISDAASVIDWVDRFKGEEARARRGLRNPADWNTILRPELGRVERLLSSGSRRVLMRGQARLPTWFALGTQFSHTRDYHVARRQNGQLWSSDNVLPTVLPDIGATVIRAPELKNELSISVAVTVDPSHDAQRCLTSYGSNIGHLSLMLKSGIGSQAITSPGHAWGAATALRDEVRRIAAQFQPSKLHLFLSMPAGLALLLGHVWDRMPDTQTYEDLSFDGYQPAFFIPN